MNKVSVYNDISNALFIGFSYFGTTMSHRSFSKEIRIYAKGFTDFARTVLEQGSVLTEAEFFELLALQKIVRKKICAKHCLSERLLHGL